ncbi:MAG TPA: hypothetical protein VL096_14555 [Pirellulaceae bacterium]|nr:hypothetical protein [Pirellulaceae bacterium]
MRTLNRVRSRSVGSSLPRVGSLMMLGVLVLLLFSFARKSNNWDWLTDGAAKEQANARLVAPVAPASSTPDQPVAPPSGPTDEDPEQQDAAREELQAVSDGTLSMLPEEMPAYWRLFYWSKNQTADQMLSRATTVALHDLLQHPSEQRGKLIQVKLNLKRVTSFKASENFADVKTVYEVWGWTEESKSWLYVGVTAELPGDMPQSADIDQHGTFVGYFLKVQGYLAANSRPNERPLSSPLLIGRFIWKRPTPIATTAEEPWWSWAIIGGIGVLVLGACLWPWLRPQAGARTNVSPELASEALANWQQADAVEAVDVDEATTTPPPMNGHGGSVENN